MKVPKFIIDMKSQPRSMKHGNRKPSTQTHSDPIDGTGAGDDGAATRNLTKQSIWSVNWGTTSAALMPLPDPPGATSDHLKQMQEMMVQQVQKLMLSMPSWSLSDFSPKSPEIPHAGIRAGEIIGWRLWWVHKEGRLRSLVRDEIFWEPGVPTTGDINQCVHISMRGPDRFGGVYSFNTYRAAMVEFSKLLFDLQICCYPTEGLVGLILGTVKLWGEVVEHEGGYRASFAKPNEFLQTYYWGDGPSRDPQELYFGETK